MSELKFDVIQKAGVINVDFEAIKNQLAVKMDEYINKEFTEDIKKEAKADIAYLRKFKKSVSDRNSEVRKAYMAPYDAFNANVKELLGVIDKPISYIDGQVKAFEEARIKEKRAEIGKAYDELVADELTDYIPLECIYGDKWNNAGTTMKSIRQEISDIAIKTQNDISVISSMNSDKINEALNLYMGNRNLANAISYINKYEAQKAEILKKQEAQEAEKLERDKQAEIDRIRAEERKRIEEENAIRQSAKREAVQEITTVNETAAAPLVSKESLKVVYTVVATPDELQEIEIALTSLGVYFERKDV